MRYFVISNPKTKEIIINGSCPDNDFDLQSIPGFDLLEGKATALTHYVDSQKIIEYSLPIQIKKAQRQPFYFEWSNDLFDWIDVRSDQEKYNFASSSAKVTRKELLVQSDWTQIANNPLTLEQQQQWATYRQALRDITAQSGYPFNIIWPTPPQG
jgi:hypothetical protein